MKPPQNEETLLHRIAAEFRDARSSSLHLGMGDDAALFAPSKGCETILSCDWFLEGSHFLRDKHPADSVGWKCLARATSDIAAMGGTPRCFLLSLAVPSSETGHWLGGFLRGLHRASKAFHCELAGGDTTRRNDILINVTVIGEIRRGRAIMRSGARPGDLLYVSGTLGEAELGLRELRRAKGRSRAGNAVLRKHLYPQPRLDLGGWLSENGLATAMMDISDGLSTDLKRICTASGVGARIESSLLPASSATKRQEALKLALNGGDDYELLFSVSAKKAEKLPKSFRGTHLTCIGKVLKDAKLLLVDEKGKERPLVAKGWDPFRG